MTRCLTCHSPAAPSRSRCPKHLATAAARKRERLARKARCAACKGVGYRLTERGTATLMPREWMAAENKYWCRSCGGSGQRVEAVRPQHAERVWEAERAA